MAPIADGHGLAFRRRVLCYAAAGPCRADPLQLLACLVVVAAVFCFFFKRRKPKAAPSVVALPTACASKLPDDQAVAPPGGDQQTLSKGAPQTQSTRGEASILPLPLAQASSWQPPPSTSPAKMPPLNLDAIKFDSSQPLQSQVAVVCVTLNEDYDKACKDERDRRAYCVSLLRPLASSLGVPKACVGVGALQPGSIVADMLLVQRPSNAPGGKGQGGREQGNVDTHSLAKELVRSLEDSASSLRANALYSKVAAAKYSPTGDLRDLHKDTVITLRNMMEPSNWPHANATTSANNNSAAPADANALKLPPGALNSSKSTADGTLEEAELGVLGDGSRLGSGSSNVDGYLTTETSPRNPPRSLGLGPLQYGSSNPASPAKDRGAGGGGARPRNPLQHSLPHPLQHYASINGLNGDAGSSSAARPPLAPPVKQGGASPQAAAASQAQVLKRHSVYSAFM
jgi:hypothetical protein